MPELRLPVRALAKDGVQVSLPSQLDLEELKRLMHPDSRIWRREPLMLRYVGFDARACDRIGCSKLATRTVYVAPETMVEHAVTQRTGKGIERQVCERHARL